MWKLFKEISCAKSIKSLNDNKDPRFVFINVPNNYKSYFDTILGQLSTELLYFDFCSKYVNTDMFNRICADESMTNTKVIKHDYLTISLIFVEYT